MTMPASTPFTSKLFCERADQQAEALVGAEELADDRADEGEAEADVQAGEDPGERRRQDDLTGDLPARGAEDAGVGDEVAVDLAGALEGVEEDPEEHQHDGQDDLRGRCRGRTRRVKSDPSTMRGIEFATLMNGDEHVGEEADPAERDAGRRRRGPRR